MKGSMRVEPTGPEEEHRRYRQSLDNDILLKKKIENPDIEWAL